MTTDIWLNLPVKDISKSRAFFTKLGFKFSERFSNSNEMAGLMVGSKNFMIMLAIEPVFEKFTGQKIADTKQGSEVLISIDAESRAEVDELTQKAAEAGGTVFGKPSENQGWMYGSGFSDLDGHRWNVLYMDMSKMPKG